MTTEERESWLLTLNIGDEVAYSSGGVFSHLVVAKITKITPSRRFDLSNGVTINNDGSVRGNNYFYIRPVTEDDRVSIWRSYVINKIKRELKIDKLSNENLKLLLKILKENNS